MSKSIKSWAKPALNRLGTIGDVAGSKKTAQDPQGQNGSTNHSTS